MQIKVSEFEEQSLEMQADQNQKLDAAVLKQQKGRMCKSLFLLIAFIMFGIIMIIQRQSFKESILDKNQSEEYLIEEVFYIKSQAEDSKKASQANESSISEEKQDSSPKIDLQQTTEKQKFTNKEEIEGQEASQNMNSPISEDKTPEKNQIQKDDSPIRKTQQPIQEKQAQEENAQKLKTPEQPKQQAPKISIRMLSMLKNREHPKNYQFAADKQKQLPVCVVHYQGSERIQRQTLGYPLTVLQIKMENLFAGPQKINLTYLNQQIHEKCVRNSIIFFLSKVPTEQYLNQLSMMYQTKSIWATFVQSSNEVKIVSVYQQLLILAQYNYLTGSQLTTSIFDVQDLTLDLLEMSLNNMSQKKLEQFDFDHGSPLSVSLSWEKIDEKRPKYDSILSMKQFSKVDKAFDSQKYNKMLQEEEGRRSGGRGLKKELMLESIQLRELVYLPANHSLSSHEKNTRESAYNLEQYSTEKPICVFIPSHNNIQDNRYQRVIDSILQQEYSNYHIVFIDDYSNDGTLLNTMRYLNKLGFPRDRIAYIQNLKKNYATYNIANGAFNYCKADDIMVLVDGDDELVGRQVFRLINAGYQNGPVWLLWTTFTSNIYTYGTSKPIHNNQKYVNAQNKRVLVHWIGHLTTFYAGFFRHIKIEAHQCLPGQWFDTLYDDAMQHPLIEMATVQHLSFIPEMTYLYNKNYGSNDDSSYWKRQYRKKLYYNKVTVEEPYQPLQSLDFSYRNEVIEEQLKKDRNTRYKDIITEQDIVNITDNIEMDQNGPCQKYIREVAPNRAPP